MDHKFSTQASSTYHLLQYEPIQVTYGTGAMWGKYGQDTVCISPDTCASEVHLLTSMFNINLEAVQADGILGLSPSTHDPETELYIEQLYNQGLIENKVFSFLIDQFDSSGSKVTIGDYSEDKFSMPNSTLNWHSLVQDKYWSMKMDQAKINGQPLKRSVD
jgi:hypothetical protein